MVAATNNSTNKTAFVVGVLQKNPKANPVIVNTAWKESGRPGSISGTLVHKLRAELGLAGNLRARSKGASGERKAAKASSFAKTVARVAEVPARSEVTQNGSHANTTISRTSQFKSRDRVLETVEGEIDRLIFSLMGVGGLDDIEEALRRVRRLVVRSLEK